MRHIKKLMAAVIAVVMAMAMSAVAFAATTETVSVSGLENGDSVNFIKVIEWDEVNGWQYVDGLEAADGDTLPDIKTITGSLDTSQDPAVFTAGSISAEHAAILAKAAAHSELAGQSVNATSGTATYENAPVGLYYAQVVPGTADYLYNTIFVGGDFKSNSSNTINASTATLAADAAQEQAAIAKKEQVTLTKDANGETDKIKYDHAVGDLIPFTITSKVPAYGAGYVDPQYSITDTMDPGLVIDSTDLTVTIGSLTIAKGTDYTVTPATIKDGTTFTVTLTKAGLEKVAKTGQAQTITIGYSAKITSIDNATVNQKKNTATVTFSNKPTDSDSVSKIEDKTRHYTFSLDANLFGDSTYETSELVKVGIDENGNEITKVTNYSNGSEHGALGGAIFGLYKTKAAAEAGVATDTPATNANMVAVQTSDSADGKLTFTGLDAADYYLVELKAPDGWIKDTTVRKVTIDAQYEEIPAGSYVDSDGVTVKYDAYKVLKSYTVAVEGGATSSYTITNTKSEATGANNHDVTADGVQKTDNVAGDQSTKLQNTRGTELPSTGGMGTTILYTVGAILVIGAVVLLITRRRMNSEK